MDYIFNGNECVFARQGDVFEPTKGGKGYIHFYSDGKYVAIPSDMVENSPFFDEIEEDGCVCYMAEDFREDVLDELESMKSSFFGSVSKAKMDKLIEFVKEYDLTCPNCDED